MPLDISSLKDHSERMRASPPAPLRLTSADPADPTAILLVDCDLGKSGTPVKLKQMVGAPGLSLEDILRGGRKNDRDIPRSGVDDVLIFENGFMTGDVLTVGRLGARVHEGMTGKLQVGRLLARPSKSSVSKRGAIQFATLVDPSASTLVSSKEQFEAFAAKHLAPDWPGGRFGVVMRQGKDCVDVMQDDDGKRPETVDAFVSRMVDTNGVLGDGPIELIPVWSLPMGQEQAMRDGDVRTERPASLGRFGTLYGKVRPFFEPSVVIIADEEEWAFKQPTGKIHRAVVGMHPIRRGFRLDYSNLPSPSFDNTIMAAPRWLYPNEAAIVAARDERVGRAAARQEDASKNEDRIKAIVQASAGPSGGFKGFGR